MLDFELRASILAMAHCYYLRISSHEEREKFLEMVCSAQAENKTITVKRFQKIITLELNDYIIRMNLQEDNAVN
jgi:hypothetical protein